VAADLLFWALGGIVAGLAMSLWKMVQTWLQGRGLWLGPNLIATIVLGPRTDRGDFHAGGLVVGMTLHLLASVAMSWCYGLLIRPYVGSEPLPLVATTMLVFVLAAWAVYHYLIAPWLAPIMRERSQPLWVAAAHVVYGAALLLWTRLPA
jgi:branched-subunit amino acid ABC-type transport system permease component